MSDRTRDEVRAMLERSVAGVADVSDASDPHALPDLEVFYLSRNQVEDEPLSWRDEEGEPLGPGFYWWACFPGCLPDSDPVGPFATEEEALADAREGVCDGE